LCLRQPGGILYVAPGGALHLPSGALFCTRAVRPFGKTPLKEGFPESEFSPAELTLFIFHIKIISN
jgi:hypothetical protein